MKRRLFQLTATILVLVLCTQASLLAQAEGADIFQKVKMLVPTGKKSKETKVTLWFAGDQLMIRSRKGGEDLKVFPYTAIKSADYSYSKHPRWKAGIGVAIAVGVFAVPLFFMKSKKHWLTVKTEEDYAVLRLHKNNYATIKTAFETRTGVKVETVGKRK